MNIPLKPLLYSAVLFSMSISSLAQIDIARTPSGKPDFNGNYDISSLTPFQRPTEFGTRLFLGEDEIEELRNREMSTRARDCLLDTSPSPRDKRQSRMPSSA